MSKLEGTDSKPRNQILERPESHESSEKKANEVADRKPRNQILETPDGNDSSEKDEKLDQKDENEGTKSGFDKDKRPIRERVSDFFKKFKEHDVKKENSETDKFEAKKETGNKSEPEKESSKQKLPWELTDEQKKEYNAKIAEMYKKRNSGETGNTSGNTEHAGAINSERVKGGGARTNHEDLEH